MLKHFGLKEIMCGIKHFAVAALAVIVAFALIGFLISISFGDGIASEVYYSTSKNYLITAEKSSDQNAVSDFERNKACANNAIALLKSDICKDFVLQHLLNDYTPEGICAFTERSYSKADFSYTVLNDKYTVNLVADSSTVNVYAKVLSKEFSEKIILYIDMYFTESIAAAIPDIGGYEVLGGTSIPIETTTSTGGLLSKNPVVTAVAFAIVGAVLSIIVIMFYVLVNPSVASKSDFSEYGLNVLDDSSEHKCDKSKFAADAVSHHLSEIPLDTLAVVTSSDSKALKKASVEIASNLGNENIKTASDISNSFDEYSKIKECSSVILIERKGTTLHKSFKATLVLLNNSSYNVIGVILI